MLVGEERRQKEKKKESSRTRLHKLAKEAFVKVGSMAWDVWIHACSHGSLGSGYSVEDFHGCIAVVFIVE